MRNLFNNQKGLSLMEIIVAVGLMGAISVGGMRFMSYVQNSSKRSRLSSNVHDLKRNIRNYINDVSSCSSNMNRAFYGAPASEGYVANYKGFTRGNMMLLESGYDFGEYKVIDSNYTLTNIQNLSNNTRFNKEATATLEYRIGFCSKGHPTRCPVSSMTIIRDEIEVPILLNRNSSNRVNRLLCNTGNSSVISEGVALGTSAACEKLGLNSDCRLKNPDGTGACDMNTHQAKLVTTSTGKLEIKCVACEALPEGNFMCGKPMLDSCGKEIGVRNCSCELDGSTYATNTTWTETAESKDRIISLKNSAEFYSDKSGLAVGGFSLLTGAVGFLGTLVDVCPKRRTIVDFKCDHYGQLSVTNTKNEPQKWCLAPGCGALDVTCKKCRWESDCK